MPEEGIVLWGRGRHGQLGSGNKKDSKVPLTSVPLNGTKMKQIDCSHFHTAAVTGTGELYTWGRGTLGLLGHNSEEDKMVPTKVEKVPSVRKVACGTYHTVACTAEGDLYTWGWCYQPGEGGVQEGYSLTPVQVGLLPACIVRSVTCGYYCTFACSNTGALYSWGRGVGGQLGHGGTQDVPGPKLVEGLSKQKVWSWEVACGKNFTVILSAEGDMYSCGDATSGHLGLGPSQTKNVHMPRLVSGLLGNKFITVSCSDQHSAAISRTGLCFTWGNGQFTRLGNENMQDLWTPAAVEAVSGIKLVKCACNVYGTIVMADDGEVYMWGAHTSKPSPPKPVSIGGTPGLLTTGGYHFAAFMGEPAIDEQDAKDAAAAGYDTSAVDADALLRELGPVAELVKVESIPSNASKESLENELDALKKHLRVEELKKKDLDMKIVQLQEQLDKAALEEQELRDAAIPKGQLPPGMVVQVPKDQYDQVNAREDWEINFLGMKMTMATAPAVSPKKA